jgi:hypothetical protein
VISRPLAARYTSFNCTLNAADPISLFFDTTMAGGTALTGTTVFRSGSVDQRFEDNATGWMEVIVEYERKIIELRRELSHYKKLVSQLLGPGVSQDEYDQPTAVVFMDAISVRVINSIVKARVPDSAIFRDYDEGEL